MDRQCKKKKNCTGAFTVLQTVQKNNNNLHMDSTIMYYFKRRAYNYINNTNNKT